MKHIKVVEKDSWIHITEAKKFESLLVRVPVTVTAPDPGQRPKGSPLSTLPPMIRSLCLGRGDSSQRNLETLDRIPGNSWSHVIPELGHSKTFPSSNVTLDMRLPVASG